MKKLPLYKVTVQLPGLLTDFTFRNVDQKNKFLRVCARENIYIHSITRVHIHEASDAEAAVITLNKKQWKRFPTWKRPERGRGPDGD